MLRMQEPRPHSISGIVARVPLFSGLELRDLREVLRTCRLQKLPGGAEILMPGQIADRFYVILAGRVKIFQLSPHGDEQILHMYESGQTFGEAAMWAGGTFPAYAEAATPVQLLVVRREDLQALITRRPELAIAMIAGLSAKLQEFNRLIERLSLKEVPARLAQVLLDLSREQRSRTVRLRQTKRELAAQIGTIAETLSRAFARLRGEGLIEVSGREIIILDPEGLADIAES